MKDIHKNDHLIAFLAAAMAIISLTVAIWDGVETRNHNRLSVKPYLDYLITSHTSEDEDEKLIINNLAI